MTSSTFFSPSSIPATSSREVAKPEPHAATAPETTPKAPRTLRHSRAAGYNGKTDGLAGTAED